MMNARVGPGMQMRLRMQPIVALHGRRPVCVLALPRVVASDGRVLEWDACPPRLGSAERDRLFRMSLDRALEHLRRWDCAEFIVDLALGLPRGTLLDARCARWVAGGLQRHAVAPQRLVLSIAAADVLEGSCDYQALMRLHGVGVKLAIDDLKAPHDHLPRLLTLPIDAIKVDGGLVRNFRKHPLQTLALVRTIVQHGRDFGREVIVQGLDDGELVEAMALLGAQFGQGNALARPMDPSTIPDWAGRMGQAALAASASGLCHAGGAVAFHWLSAREAPEAHRPDAASCPVGRFLEGLHGAEEARRWHARLHALDARPGASAQLFRCLRDLMGPGARARVSGSPA